MNETKYRYILYIIVTVIIATIGIQVYWNYKNYEVNKQQFINDVQNSLDNAIETYYASLAKKNSIGFAIEMSTDNVFDGNKKIDSIISSFTTNNHNFSTFDSLRIDIDSFNKVKLIKGINTDSFIKSVHFNHKNNNHFKNEIEFKTLNSNIPDSLALDNFKQLTSKVIFSMSQDTLELKSIDSLVKLENSRKKIDLSFGLSLNNHEKIIEQFNDKTINNSTLVSSSNSTFLPNNKTLKIHFNNTTKEILKRILTGILISTLLVLAVISCLFYLLKIIKHQKQVAEVKNDFISNVTHEFKTPIATIGVALESIKNFNVIEDKEKTKTYLDMSSSQLTKLNTMVEKLLETASLDSENLQLKKEQHNVVEIVKNLIIKHKLELNAKSLSFSSISDHINANIDAFHFENAINNIIDNAIKYGGEYIKVDIKQSAIGFTIAVSDNGNSLTKTNTSKLFEKFYRIPKGNTHDVKGFGIGLYYAKKIIEKHEGVIQLNLDNNWTTFNITIPNA